MRILIAALLICACMSATLAEEVPSVGNLYGRIDKDYMRFRCSPPHGNELTCHFIQISISKRLKAEDAEKQAKVVDEELRRTKDKGAIEFCAEVLKSANAPIDHLDATTQERAKATRRLCAEKSPGWQDNLMARIRSSAAEERGRWMRTCRLNVNDFQQKFVRANESWVHNRGPIGACGMIYVTKFTPVEFYGVTFWSYSTRKIITNKRGMDNSGIMKCSDWDETEHVYDWREQEFEKGCDFVALGL